MCICRGIDPSLEPQVILFRTDMLEIVNKKEEIPWESF